MTMVTAWDYPQNPLTEGALDQSKLSKEIEWGYRLFTDTPAEAARFVGGQISCNNCHLNGGQRERAMPLVAIAGAFPEYNRRAGRLISLNDRIVDCFLRSENATSKLERDADGNVAAGAADMLPNPTSREVLALAAYLAWISRGAEIGKNPAWRGQNAIPQTSLIPVDKPRSAEG
jgi:thiosulfate dehydrogenase